MSRSRFLTSSLATVAVAATITLAGPTAHAADAVERCGFPGTPAVFQTVQHPAITEVVPEQSHTEWVWQRLVDHYTYEWSKLLSAEQIAVDWTRQVPGPLEHEYSEKVIDVAYQAPVAPIAAKYEWVLTETTPAVTQTYHRYELRKPTGGGGYVVLNVQWQPDGWAGTHGNDPESVWVQTPDTRLEEIEPAVWESVWTKVADEVPGTEAVQEVSHLKYDWFTADPGTPWTATGNTRPGDPVPEDQTTSGAMPAGDGWTEVARRVVAAADHDIQWAAQSPGDGYVRTDATPRMTTTTETAPGTSADAPSVGEGWTKVVGSAVTVIDAEETTRIVEAVWTEQVLVEPVVPATAPCGEVAGPRPDAPKTPEVPDTQEDPRSEVLGAPVAPAGDLTVAPQAAPEPTTGVLPNTGNDATAGAAATGFGAMLLGAVLMLVGRRKRFSAN